MRYLPQAGGVLLAAALVVLILAALVFQHDAATYRAMTARSDRIHLAADTAEAALSALKDAETGQRGYLITAERSYLKPYRDGVREWSKDLAELQKFAAEDPQIAPDVDAAARASAAKIDELSGTLNVHDSGRRDAAIANVKSGSGQIYMNRVRDAISHLIQIEEAEVAANDAAVEKSVATTRFRILVAVAALFLLTLAGTLLLSLEIRNERRLATNLERSEKQARELAETLEVQVAERTQHLQEVNDALQSFSYSVSHDLRAPLRSIDGFSLILLEDYSDRLDEAGRDMLNRIRAATSRMGKLIQSLLDLARVTGKEMKREPVSITELAESIMEGLRAAAPERKVETRIEPGMEANADPNLMRIVMENLLSNAWKFTSRKDAARIEVGRTEVDGKPAFFVRDNGSGFNPQLSSKLFRPLQRLHSESEFEGSGIGLATVQRIIQRHEGRIWAESRPGEGSTFFFTM